MFTDAVYGACWVAAMRSRVERKRILDVHFKRDANGVYRSMWFELEAR